MNTLHRTILLAAATLGLLSCEAAEDLDSLRSLKSERTVWVFAQFNVVSEDDELDTYYYYGRVAEALYTKIKFNKLTRGFFLMEDVAYYSNKDDKLHSYRDEEQKGELVFRIEDIKRIKLLARPPKVEKFGPPETPVEPAPAKVLPEQALPTPKKAS